MNPQPALCEVPAAGSPLMRTTLDGPPRQALVLGSFPTALYLSAGEHHEVLPLLAADALMLPTGVRLSAPARDLVWGVEPGDAITIGRGEVRLRDWSVRVVREWRPTRVRVVHPIAEQGQLFECADILSCHASAPGLVDQAAAVCRAARSADDAAVRRCTRQLIGAGQGLTPAGDDILCAVLLVLNGIGEEAPTVLLADAVRERWAVTTSLSASLLDASTRGYAVPEVVALVDSALRADIRGVHRALPATLAIGHSSGRDLVAGLAGSLRAIVDANPRPDTCRVIHPYELTEMRNP